MSHFFTVHLHVCYVSIHFFPFLGVLHTNVALILWPCTVSLCPNHLFTMSLIEGILITFSVN